MKSSQVLVHLLEKISTYEEFYYKSYQDETVEECHQALKKDIDALSWNKLNKVSALCAEPRDYSLRKLPVRSSSLLVITRQNPSVSDFSGSQTLGLKVTISISRSAVGDMLQTSEASTSKQSCKDIGIEVDDFEKSKLQSIYNQEKLNLIYAYEDEIISFNFQENYVEAKVENVLRLITYLRETFARPVLFIIV
ncbi:2474_t:CDS:2 [Funneliformis caledonium]|uniref:2474_t:CDS:1 n=1 Tax=Funneliformis caledonium TaxID=1117310 RepID=A0A9N8WKW2_9GLOM|nr:2474_t:CDS:2 [Funneliformis caledonium]